MKIAGLDHVFTRAELLFETFEVIAVVIVIVEAIRRDPKDRVLLFEFLALVTFFLGLSSVKFSGFAWPALTVWMVLFAGFTLAAAYYGLLNWVRRKKRAN